jgi:hypothetical protein
MISGPSDVVDEGTGSGCDDADDGIPVGAGAGGVDTASDVEADVSGGAAIDEEGRAEASGGGAIEEDGDGCTELSGAPDILGVTEDDDMSVVAGTPELEDDGAGSVGVGVAACEDEVASVDDDVAELDSTGSGIAEETGISEAPLGSGVVVGMTVVYDVTITTGGTWRDADGDTSAGAFDGVGVGVPVAPGVEETSEADS